jgi:hypothetical protein
MTIKFSDDATVDTFAAVLGDLTEWSIDLDHENDGYPSENVLIVGVTGDALTVCEIVDSKPQRNSTWDVPIEGLRSITIL